MTLEARKAVVTGASRGIGRAIAIHLARAGAEVVCVSTRPGGCDGTQREIEEFGGSSIALTCDVAQESQVADLAERVLDSGPPSILVNNAGVTRDGSFLRMSIDDFDAVLRVNLRGVFLTTKAFLRPMLKAVAPRIINVGSVVGLGGNAGQVNYAASKAGLVGLTRSIAREFGSRGLTANLVAPGFIDTDMTKELTAEIRAAAIEKIPLRRLGTPADVAGLVTMLASDAGAYITGQVLVVDGGMTL